MEMWIPNEFKDGTFDDILDQDSDAQKWLCQLNEKYKREN